MRNKFILLSLVLVTLLCFNTNCMALTTLYETTTSERISSGVVLKNYNRLTEKGWLDVNILEVDLEDKYTTIGVLNSKNGLNTFQTVLEMAKNYASIAAINGDFFAGKSTKGHTVGLSVSEGKLLTSTYEGNESKNEFASFVLNEDNEAFIDYFKNTITIKSKNKDDVLEIKEYNKHSTNYDTRPAIYTSDWGETSVGSFDYLAITEMLVKNNKVKK